MEQIVFVKYNKTRKEEFQIKTSILEREDGSRFVEKAALYLPGREHIRSLKVKYEQILKIYPGLSAIRPEISEDGLRARFEYLSGESLAERLGRSVCGGQVASAGANQAVVEIGEELDFLLPCRGEFVEEFHSTPEFEAVFGPDGAALTDVSYPVSNVDGLFENMMLDKGKVTCIDYEWVFDFPVPVGYLRYRNLYYFYDKYKDMLPFDQLSGYLSAFGITPGLADTYLKMELSFQAYVHGENGGRAYLENYLQSCETLEEMAQKKEDLARAMDRILQLQDEVEERNVFIKKEQEIKRLTNNHVANLETIITNLRREVEEQGKLLTYLNSHEALIFKLRRKLGQGVSRVFPEGTRKRKVLKYCKNTIRHPGQYGKLYLTKEGRNRISGDFKIGEAYLEHGRLVFPKVEAPEVSVVIPCYNQIHYTYQCLRSILEHTEDISYEIIIADDVSSDATSELEKFAENLVISRNVMNQGFLRNCNQAAKMARGRYVMFLNNDTQVTPGWLSSLVNLIESDSSIGMVGSKLVYPDGRLQEAGGIIWSDGSGWNYGRLDDPDKAEYNYVKDVDYISGAAILLSAELWKKIGGFDDRFAPAYCEDSDLAFEVRRAGYRVVYQPLSKIIHFEGISNGTDVNGTGLKRYQVENSRKLKAKWSEEFKKQCLNDGNPNPFLARERAMGKPVILVIDHYVPTFDRDAGSKTTYQYLKMFLKKGYVVKLLGDNFLHEEPYSTTFQQMGIEILYGQEYQAGIWEWLEKNGSMIDFAYLNRPHIAVKYVDFLSEKTGVKMIYYGHDLHFLRENREYELTGDIKKKRESDYWKAIELNVMHHAAVSYYPSYIERDAIHAIDPKVNVKAITAYVYDEFLDHVPDDFARREGLLFVGGFAHPPNADAVLWFAREIFPRIRSRIRMPFYIAGSKVTEEIRALQQPENGIIVKGFVTDEELTRLYATCRLVVVPLRYGAGVKGKVVEAIYHGAPVVTTSIGAEGIPEVDQVLSIKDEPIDFADEVIRLYQNPEECRRMSQISQAYIREHFSEDAAWSVVEEDFRPE